MTSPSDTSPRTLQAGELTVRINDTAADLGRDAAAVVADALNAAIAARGEARAILATGNSQFPLMEALADHDIAWDKVTAFHMDEYLDISDDHPASFRRWMRERVAEGLGVKQMHYINGNADPEEECARYEALLREAPIDLTCMGIGENGHLAFNEPYDAKFDDPRLANVITLNAESRAQQVGEGHFPDDASVPQYAISLSIPALVQAETVVVSAPEQRKAKAVRAALNDEISTACPATYLRTVGNATLFLDAESASLL
ncbi:6-phosphogluconolactonase [Propionibacteriaceae bacterium Y2011]|uniref:6-phosphogluconolactonase n=1 Tax=Microlunatus sp. Y2014 TaxID=3418488 RepID=UPI003B4F0B5A